MLTKEPLRIAGYLSTIIGFLVAKYLPSVDGETKAAIVALAIMLVGAIVEFLRSKAFSENTIREAGLDPKVVESMADDPEVRPVAKKKRASR